MLKELSRFFSKKNFFFRKGFHKIWKDLPKGSGVLIPALAAGAVIGAIVYAVKEKVEN